MGAFDLTTNKVTNQVRSKAPMKGIKCPLDRSRQTQPMLILTYPDWFYSAANFLKTAQFQVEEPLK